MSTGKRIWDLIAKKLSGEAEPAELKELEDLLREHPEIHYPMQHVADLWHHKLPPDTNAYEAFERHTQKMRAVGIDFADDRDTAEEEPPAIVDPRPSRRKRRLLTAAGLTTAAVLAGFWFFKPAPKEMPVTPSIAAHSEVSTKYGSRTKLVLPDGTQVWLNSGSKLTYDSLYGASGREVLLTGEAYFDVAKNAARPFIIHAPGFSIRVLGTAFNVRSFPGEKKSETSLIKGSIEVTFTERPAERIVLKPNEKLVITNENAIADQPAAVTVKKKENNPQEPIVAVSHLSYTQTDSTVIETSWMEN
ncbi:MAG: FecR domain-containing protein, partial [Bacteroidetes bacterium]|nr:FecR domain-containing protein [Bacteroidota bacterium]